MRVYLPSGGYLASLRGGDFPSRANFRGGNPKVRLGAPLTGHTTSVLGVALSPDGHRIASGSADNTVRLWNADTGQQIGDPLTGHTGPVRSVAFSPDGHRIASASADKTVRLWPTYPDPVSAVCTKLTANMSHKEWNDWVSPDIAYIKVCPDLPIAPD